MSSNLISRATFLRVNFHESSDAFNRSPAEFAAWVESQLDSIGVKASVSLYAGSHDLGPTVDQVSMPTKADQTHRDDDVRVDQLSNREFLSYINNVASSFAVQVGDQLNRTIDEACTAELNSEDFMSLINDVALEVSRSARLAA